MSNDQVNQAGFAKTACDQCHRCKLRCTRELPHCERCRTIGSACTFSTGRPIGKPRGSKNKNSKKKTAAAAAAAAAAVAAANQQDVLTKPKPEPERVLKRKASLMSAHSDAPPNTSHTNATTEGPWDTYFPQHANNGFMSVSSPRSLQQADSSVYAPAQPIEYHQQHSKASSEMSSDVEMSNMPLHLPEASIFQTGENHSYNPSTTASIPTSTAAFTYDLLPPTASLPSPHHHSQPTPPHNHPPFEKNPALISEISSATAASGPRKSVTPFTFTSSSTIPSNCLCDPTGLRIIESFQSAWRRPATASLDRSLLLLRTGVTMCQQSLTCASCRQGPSQLVPLLLMQGALRCYSSFLAQQRQQGGAVGEGLSGIAVGEFEVEDDVRGEVVAAVVRAEMRRGFEVLERLEGYVEREDGGTEDAVRRRSLGKAIGSLSRALREEFAG